jgi:hypothetical protein
LYLYDATFIFQEPLRVHVITSLSSSTLRKADVCYIQMFQVTLECPDLDFPIRLPFIQMNQLTSELLLTEIERVLQSNEQFVLENDSVEMLSRYHMYLISYQESLKRFYIFDSALM